VSVLSQDATDHFFNPRNVGDADEPSFVGRAASVICGAHVRFSVQVDQQQRVSQAKFKAAGCSVLVASASMLTERVLNVPTAEAAIIGQDPDALRSKFSEIGRGKEHSELSPGFCEPAREHCPGLACDALLAAVREFSDAAREEWGGDEALICTCFFVSERTIEREIATRGLSTVAEVTRVCNAGGGCGSCHQLIQEILDTQHDLPR
jgi:NifU-like protein